MKSWVREESKTPTETCSVGGCARIHEREQYGEARGFYGGGGFQPWGGLKLIHLPETGREREGPSTRIRVTQFLEIWCSINESFMIVERGGMGKEPSET